MPAPETTTREAALEAQVQVLREALETIAEITPPDGSAVLRLAWDALDAIRATPVTERAEAAQITIQDGPHICDYPTCSERGSGHPLACNCRSGSAPPQPERQTTTPACSSDMPIERQIVALDRASNGMTFDADDMRAAWRTLINLKGKRTQAVYPFAELGRGSS